MIRQPPRPPLFPYTPLFRPHRRPARVSARPRRERTEPVRSDALDGRATLQAAELRRARPRLYGNRRRASTPVRALLRSEEHTSELQSPCNLVCRLLLEKKTA